MADGILGQLIIQTTHQMETPGTGDTWEQITKKLAKRKKIEYPAQCNSFNSLCLGAPGTFLPLLCIKEGMQAVQNYQSFIRSMYNSQPHLTDEVCQLCLSVSNSIIVMGDHDPVAPVAGVPAAAGVPAVLAVAGAPARAAIPHLLQFETLESILAILDSKLLYLKGKKLGLGSGEIHSVDTTTTGNPSDANLQRMARKGGGGNGGRNNNNRNNNNGNRDRNRDNNRDRNRDYNRNDDRGRNGNQKNRDGNRRRDDSRDRKRRRSRSN